MIRDPSVLFVCLGNICRSPLAEGAFLAAARHHGLEVRVGSAGTGGWHVGNPPDPRAQAVALAHGVDISGQRARQLQPLDLTEFTHVVALDRENLRAIGALGSPAAAAKVSLLLDHVPGRAGQSVADPYYGDAADFEQAWADVCAGAEGLIRTLSTPR